MGKNTPDRQDFIIENLRIEEDIVEQERMSVKSERFEMNGRSGFLN